MCKVWVRLGTGRLPSSWTREPTHPLVETPAGRGWLTSSLSPASKAKPLDRVLTLLAAEDVARRLAAERCDRIVLAAWEGVFDAFPLLHFLVTNQIGRAFSSYAAWKLLAAAARARPAQQWSELTSTTSEALRHRPRPSN